MDKCHIRKEQLLHELIDFMVDNVGNLTFSQSISDTLLTQRGKADRKTVKAYINYLCCAFAFYRVRRYDIRGMHNLQAEDKFYLADHDFKYARLDTKNMDYDTRLRTLWHTSSSAGDTRSILTSCATRKLTSSP